MVSARISNILAGAAYQRLQKCAEYVFVDLVPFLSCSLDAESEWCLVLRMFHDMAEARTKYWHSERIHVVSYVKDVRECQVREEFTQSGVLPQVSAAGTISVCTYQ